MEDVLMAAAWSVLALAALALGLIVFASDPDGDDGDDYEDAEGE